MSFYAALRDDLVQRSDALAADTKPRRRPRRWPFVALGLATVAAGGSVAVAELTQPAAKIALETAGGPRGIATGFTPITIRDSASAGRWEVAAFEDRAGGLGMAASTKFDPRPANMATAGSEVQREIRQQGGAMVYGVVQIGDDPSVVVVYGAADSATRRVLIEGQPARFADRTVQLTAWTDAAGLGESLGRVRVFAAEVRLPAGLTADRVNGRLVGEAAANSDVAFRSTR